MLPSLAVGIIAVLSPLASLLAIFKYFGFSHKKLEKLGKNWKSMRTKKPGETGPTVTVSRSTVLWIVGFLLISTACGFYFLYGDYGKYHVPILTSWRSDFQGTCETVVDTTAIKDLAGDYDVGAACLLVDNTGNPMEQTNILVSGPMIIKGTYQPIVATAHPNSEFTTYLKTIPDGTRVTMWYRPFIVPKNTDTNAIRNLADIARLNGRVYFPQTKSQTTTQIYPSF